jgi:RNA polymerase sigma-70 factor (ECF subfamily)
MDPLAETARAAREGDPIAVAALVRATQSDVWRFCAHVVDVADADDLAQETYLRALRALPSYAGLAPFRVWLLAIARRACADAVRSKSRRRRLFQRLSALPAEQVRDTTGDLGASDLLYRLDPDRRAAFVMTQVLGMSYAETAAACDVPVGTVRSRVARARNDLQRAVRQADVG